MRKGLERDIEDGSLEGGEELTSTGKELKKLLGRVGLDADDEVGAATHNTSRAPQQRSQRS